MEKNIISSSECEYSQTSDAFSPDKIGQHPTTLRTITHNKLIGKIIIEWSCNLGSYGMGGPGFFGLRLSGDDFDEWLILTLWGAGQWLLLDKQWVEAHPNYYNQQKPLYSNFSGQEQWDAVTDKLVGCKLLDIDIKDNFSTLLLQSDKSGQHRLEIPQDTTSLPLYGSGKQRIWNKQESQKDAWVVTSKSLWIDDEE